MPSRRLPSTVVQAPDTKNDPYAWMDQAACAGMAAKGNFRKDGDPFYPVSSAPFAAAPGKNICKTCPVIRICYDYSQEKQCSQFYGTFGGLSEEERRRRRRLNLKVTRDLLEANACK